MEHFQESDHPRQSDQSVESRELRYFNHLDATNGLLLQQLIKGDDCDYVD
jgi:hypothetical protein